LLVIRREACKVCPVFVCWCTFFAKYRTQIQVFLVFRAKHVKSVSGFIGIHQHPSTSINIHQRPSASISIHQHSTGGQYGRQCQTR
jgi:hypothetical protein